MAFRKVKKKSIRSLGDRDEILERLLCEPNLTNFSSFLCQKRLVTFSTALASNISYNDVMREVVQSMEMSRTISNLKDACDALVYIFEELGGPFTIVAEELKEDWDALFAQCSGKENDVAKERLSSPLLDITDPNRDHISELAQHLKNRYKSIPDIPQDDPWLNVDVNMQYIPLVFENISFLEERCEISYEELFNTSSELSNKRILITGRPGAGKTVLLTKISKDWSNEKCLQNVTILLHVSLRRLAIDICSRSSRSSDCFSKLEDIVSTFFEYKLEADIAKYAKAIADSSGEGVCFAFDGLDEYANRSDLYTPNDFVKCVINKSKLPLSSAIITCRPDASGSVPIERPIIEILGFKDKQISEYVEYCFHTLDSRSQFHHAQQLLRYLDDHLKVKETCRLPLYLAIIVKIYQLLNGLPSTETEIYLYFVLHSIRRYLGREKNAEMTFSNIDDLEDVHKEEYHLFLDICHVAYLMRYNSYSVISDGKLKDILKLESMPIEHTKVRKGLGILYSICKKIGPGFQLQFSFQHHAIQEYLGAYHLSKYHLNDLEKYPYIDTCRLLNMNHMRGLGRFFFGIVQTTDHFSPCFDHLLELNDVQSENNIFLMQCLFEVQSGTVEESCKKFLQSRNSILNVSRVILTTPDCSAIGYVMCHCPEMVKGLLMNYCKVNSTGIDALQSHITEVKFPEMENLQLNYNPLYTEGLSKLSTGLLPCCENVKCLGFCGCNLSSDAGKILSKALSRLTMVLNLELYLNHLGDDGIANMIDSLKATRSLQQLSVTKNDITDVGGCLLSEVVKFNTSLRQMRLYYNELTYKTRMAFSNAARLRIEQGYSELLYAI